MNIEKHCSNNYERTVELYKFLIKKYREFGVSGFIEVLLFKEIALLYQKVIKKNNNNIFIIKQYIIIV